MKFRLLGWFVLMFFANNVLQSQYLDSLQYLKGFKSNEPSLAIEQSDPFYQFIGGNLDHYFLSDDGGSSWRHRTLRSTMGVYGDPVVKIAASGRYYFAHLAKAPNKPYPASFDRIVFQFSDSRGQEFNDGVGIGLNEGKMQDKPWFFVLSSKDLKPENDKIALCWTEFDQYKSESPQDSARIRFAISTDGGQNFSEPITISTQAGGCMDDLKTPEGATPVILPDSSIHVTWAMNEKIWYSYSNDMGKTWSLQQAIATQKGGWPATQAGFMRTNMMPFLITDPYHNLHLIWGQYNHKNHQHIYLKTSFNRGNSWTQAQIISQQRNEHGNLTHNFLPFPCSDPISGKIYVVYYSRPVGAQYFCEVVVTTFSPKVNKWQTTKQNPVFLTAGENVFFGDYNAIDASHNKVRAVWTHHNKGKVFLATATYNPDPPPKSMPFRAELDHRADSLYYLYLASPNKKAYKYGIAKEYEGPIHFLYSGSVNHSWLPWKRNTQHEFAIKSTLFKDTNTPLNLYLMNRRGKVLHKIPITLD